MGEGQPVSTRLGGDASINRRRFFGVCGCERDGLAFSSMGVAFMECKGGEDLTRGQAASLSSWKLFKKMLGGCEWCRRGTRVAVTAAVGGVQVARRRSRGGESRHA